MKFITSNFFRWINRLKILYVNNFFTEYGGAENSIRLISSLMKQKGHDVYYYATNKQPYFEENYEYSKYFPEYSDKRNLGLNNLQGIASTFYNMTALINLLKYLEEIKPDIASIHNVQYHLSYSVVEACKKLDIPMVLYLHDPRIFCPGGTLSYDENYCNDEHCIKGNSLNCVLKKCKDGNIKGSTLVALNTLFTRQLKIFEKVEAVICPSVALSELAVRAGVQEEKINVINHFIDTQKFDITPSYENQGYFLYVGRLDREKGVHYLIQAMKNLPSDVKLHIVGKGYEMENLQNLARELGLDNVVFKGYLSGAELNAEYQGCIATILPCNWFEVFGRTILESFLHGKPVIASNIAAIPEIVEHEVNGLLFEPANIEELSQAMLYFLNHPEKAKEFGQNGRKKAETLYNPEVYYEKYYRLLESLV